MNTWEKVKDMEEELERCKAIIHSDSILKNDHKNLYKYILDDCEITLEGFVLAESEEEAREMTGWGRCGNDLTIEYITTTEKLTKLFIENKLNYFEEDF